MIIGVLIACSSFALFAYWFRFTCKLILSTKTCQDYSYQIAASNDLGFAAVKTASISASGDDLDRLASDIGHDYQVIRRLLDKTEAIEPTADALEETILRVNFNLLNAAYLVVRPLSEPLARVVLAEMADVVSHFANTVGERSMATTACAAATYGQR
jgi:hypothetical protein